ncbi:hypothetical protein niasHS_006267 [Heterodera schachtii]|uniref:Ribosomal RNA methyltransferase FtsJ domain-containing protein n=1 Tax=Heterodera schachtii TaxID=97005 RepID=A0ABD2JST7_HETSC
MDVRQSYGQLVSTLGHKSFLLGGQNVVDKCCEGNGKQQKCDEFEEESFEKLGQIRDALNSVKCRVNSVCARHGTDRWHSFTSFTHPLKGLPAWVSSRIIDSFAAKQQKNGCEGLSSSALLLYTQAFCKFVQLINAHSELLAPFKQCQNGRSSPRSLHLCELPGAFVAALKHSLSLEQSNALQWFINGLNPHWEWTAPTLPSPSPSHCSAAFELNNDLLLLDEDSECSVGAFGWSGAGDVMPEDEWDDAFLAHRFGILPGCGSADNGTNDFNKFDLVTADGGFDCADNPSCQELLMLPLIKRQIQIALKCLRPGGTFLLKVFTFFEREMVALIASLCAAFREVRCTKPPSSKPSNSEVYLLCLDFIGCSSSVFANQNGHHRCQFDQIFLERVLDAARALAGHQIAFIEFNLATFRRLSQDERTIISIEKCSTVELWGARILSKIRPEQCPKLAQPSHYFWHQIWHPKNSDKILRLMEQLRHDGPAFSQFAPLIFMPNCAPFFAWLLSQQQLPYSNGRRHTTTNGADNGDERNGIGLGGSTASAFVVFGRIGDVAQRNGTRRVEHSLFAHPNWLKGAEMISDFCSDVATKMGYQEQCVNITTNNGVVHHRRLSSKLEWLGFLVEQCQSVASSNLSSLELSLAPSEAILSRFSASVFVTLCSIFQHVQQTFCQNGSAKFRFSQPNPTICVPLSHFLASICSVYKARIDSDERWTLLKFLPLRFFEMPVKIARENENGKVCGDGQQQQQLKLGEQIAEFNARTIALSRFANAQASPKTTPILSNDNGTIGDRIGNGPTEAPKAKRMRRDNPPGNE